MLARTSISAGLVRSHQSILRSSIATSLSEPVLALQAHSAAPRRSLHGASPRRAARPAILSRFNELTRALPPALPEGTAADGQEGKKRKERLVIIGSGWGGLTLLKAIDKSRYDVHIVSSNSYMSNTPLLSQACTGALDFRSVMEPVRAASDLSFHHAWVDHLDIQSQRLLLMPAYPPAFQGPEPFTLRDNVERVHRAKLQPSSSSSADRLPSSIPPQTQNKKTRGRVPSSVGGYATSFKKPAYRRDVEGTGDEAFDYLESIAGNVSIDPKTAEVHPLDASVQVSTNGEGAADSSLNAKLDQELTAEAQRYYVLPYDKLVIAAGAYNRTFSTPGVKENAWFLKDVQNARSIRWRLLETLEQASHPGLPEEDKRRLLTWIVVGGGPTGSELMGELRDFAAKDLKRIFPELAPLIHLILVDSADAILNSFDRELAEYAREKFVSDRIDLRLGRKITRVEPGVLHIEEDGEVPFGLLCWSTGITSSPLIRSIEGIKKERRSVSLLTDDALRCLKSAPGEELTDLRPEPTPSPASRRGLKEGEAVPPKDEAYDNIWAIGDCAIIQGRLMPATAQVATAKARHLASVLNGEMEDEEEAYFRHSSRGAMTNLGGSKGIADLPGRNKLRGRAAWVLWRGAYTWMSLSWRNRFSVPLGWAIKAVFGRDISRF